MTLDLQPRGTLDVNGDIVLGKKEDGTTVPVSTSFRCLWCHHGSTHGLYTQRLEIRIQQAISDHSYRSALVPIYVGSTAHSSHHLIESPYLPRKEVPSKMFLIIISD